ncbi:MAG: bifunctional metallophosphatase/5'-nucleotidase [Muribaculaceae bacterium]|nr:bifunctional metallophosphatase/5'-nucleotidase [Muribaculaceae bacterium]
MNIIVKSLLTILLPVALFTPAKADKLVILHTNDTHSQIDPNDKNLGGVLRRKVVIDSVKANNRNTLVVDAGDAVQGTMFFNLYGGEVEYKMLDLLGYDMAIVGNHDFDNGSEALAKLLAKSNTRWLSTNYDLKGGPLENIFEPYAIYEFDGKKIGFIGLNLRPHGMIADGNYNGVEYLDGIKAANSTAWHLRHNEKADMVIAISHLGYSGKPAPKDIDIASQSEDIDIIIGGHSHSYINPADSAKAYVKNAVGKPVLIAQVGKQGMNVGQITIDLDDLSHNYSTITVDSRLDDRTSPDLAAILVPYRAGVDSLMQIKVAESAGNFENSEPALINFVSDFAFEMGRKLNNGKPVDLAFMNKGSLRRSLPKGDVTLGMIMMMQPFNNYFEVIDVKGKDLLDAFDVMAMRGGDGVSANVEAVMKDRKCTSVKIDGKKIDPNKTYRLITIDYLANGGDYMESLISAPKIARSKQVVYKDLLEYLKTDMKGQKINPSNVRRMHQ